MWVYMFLFVFFVGGLFFFFFFFQAEDGIRDLTVTGVQTCALPIYLPLGVDTFRMAGSMLGTCCAIVLSDAADPVLSLHNLMRFYRHESCGQCTPCREGCGWIERILDKIIEGDGSIEELNQVSEIASDITGNTICAFGDGAAQPALAF